MEEKDKKTFESLSKEEQAKYMLAYQMMQNLQKEESQPSLEPTIPEAVIEEEQPQLVEVLTPPPLINKSEPVSMFKSETDTPSMGAFPEIKDDLPHSAKSDVIEIPSLSSEDLVNEIPAVNESPIVTQNTENQAPSNSAVQPSASKDGLVSNAFDSNIQANYTIRKEPIKVKKTKVKAKMYKQEKKEKFKLPKVLLLLVVFVVLVGAAFIIIKINEGGVTEVGKNYCRALENANERLLNEYKIVNGKQYLPFKESELQKSKIVCSVSDTIISLTDTEIKTLKEHLNGLYGYQNDIKQAYRVDIKGTITTDIDIYTINTELTIIKTQDNWKVIPPQV